MVSEALPAASDALLSEPNIPAPIRPTTPPKRRLPAGSCDSHAHVFDALARRPVLPGSHFRPHACPLDDYVHMLRTIGCDRAVLVQPSVYGTDNRYVAEAIRLSPLPMRGVAVVDERVTDRELEALHEQGFRGIRINTASATPGLKLAHAPRLAERIRHLGWHLQFFVDLKTQGDAIEVLRRLPVDVVIDHFGKVDAAQGCGAGPFKALLELMAYGHCWAKLTGPYFVSTTGPGFGDVAPLVQALVGVAPERLVWGTDWPHPSAHGQMPDDGHLVDLLGAWVFDDAAGRRVLVDNPRRLYGFA